MTELATIFQCPECLRLFNAANEWLPHPLRAFVPESVACGASDCAVVKAERLDREQAKERAKRERRSAAAESGGRPGPMKQKPRRMSCSGRLPFKENQDDTRTPVLNRGDAETQRVEEVSSHSVGVANSSDAGMNPRSASPRLGGELGHAAKDLGQAGFVASGAADGANERLIAFFEVASRHGHWFTARFLLETVMQWKSTHMNNRAVDVRPHFLKKFGLYLDNDMRPAGDSKAVVSSYRLCPLAEALSLSDADKERLAQEYNE